MTTSFLEKMAESAKVALDTFGLAYDAVVPSDDMLIVMNPKEKRNAQSSHGGFAGKSLIDKIRDDLDEVFKDGKEHQCDTSAACIAKTCLAYDNPFAEGMCQALGILRGTSCDEEWEMTEYRYAQSKR